MSEFMLVLKNDYVKAYRLINNQLDIISFAGEISIPRSVFWDKFKQKIEYSAGESLAFAVLSDQTDFSVDQNIIIAEQFRMSPEILSSLMLGLSFAGAKMTYYPAVREAHPSPKVIQQVKQEAEPSVQEDAFQKTSLQSFYRKKTRNYQSR